MGEILLDNLSISRLPINSEYFDKDDIHFQNYIYSLILWDKIICIKDKYKSFMRYSVSMRRTLLEEINKLNMRYINKKLGIYYIDEDLYEYIDTSHKIVSDMEIEDKNIKIAEDVVYYILLGYNLGVNICLSSERSKFIKLKHLDDYFFNRLDIINIVEKEVQDFYNEINSRIGKKVICFQSPLLLDYICREARDFNQALDMAIKMKNEKHLVKYRQTMNKMEMCLNKGNFVKFNEYLSIIPDIINSIRISGIKTQSFEIGFNPIPNISTTFNLRFGKKSHNKLHMRFLKDLAEFGMTERIYRI